MSTLDSRKQIIIDEFKIMSQGKSKEEILPLILALSNKARQSGIQFTNADILLVIDQIKDGLTPQEQMILPEILAALQK